ncbi:hypothetical protein GCM10011396_07000 [Undibacterium terreum]|uniref:Uncharacterized protein n=1 Tax=Undibacterium terreum TaxID=1224302 RepID=A0A916U7I9_9BURK|nr:hypothetical protein GCM10011396_07000 [Undibacterium terreum]
MLLPLAGAVGASSSMLLAYVTVLPYQAILFPYRDKGAKALSSSAAPSQANFATASKCPYPLDAGLFAVIYC